MQIKRIKIQANLKVFFERKRDFQKLQWQFEWQTLKAHNILFTVKYMPFSLIEFGKSIKKRLLLLIYQKKQINILNWKPKKIKWSFALRKLSEGKILCNENQQV